MNPILIYASAIVIVLTAALHSILGEKRLIAPLLAEAYGPLASRLGRQVTRFAWHFTTVLMVLSALLLLATPDAGVIGMPMVVVIGATYVLVGIVDGILTRGKHIGWWFLTLAGILALLALF